MRNVIYDYFPLGFNITFNKKLYDTLFEYKPKHIYYHDTWPTQVAVGVGKFLTSDEPSVKYRRQAGAVTYSNHSKLSLFMWRLKRFFGSNSFNLKNNFSSLESNNIFLSVK